jgi:hypothetical protein
MAKTLNEKIAGGDEVTFDDVLVTVPRWAMELIVKRYMLDLDLPPDAAEAADRKRTIKRFVKNYLTPPRP